jgi:hypothetical protein
LLTRDSPASMRAFRDVAALTPTGAALASSIQARER